MTLLPAKHRTAYINARLLDPASGLDAPGALLAEDGRITDLGPQLFAEGVPAGIQTVDCGGACLAPGLVDMRVNIREPGEEQKETMGSAGRAAAAGGVTAMVALPNTDPVIDDVAGVEYIARRAREEKRVKVYTYAAVTRGTEGRELTELGMLGEYGAVAFTDGVKAVASAQVMRRALSYAKTFGHLIVQHPEEPSLAGGVMNGGEMATRLGLPGIPSVAEVMMVERDLRLVELTGGRYHVAHVSTAETVDAIRAAKARGLNVTCDTAPHYMVLNEIAVGDYRTFAKVSPPLRSEDGPPAPSRQGHHGRHHRRHRQRPQSPRSGIQASALRGGGTRHRRPGDASAALPPALPRPEDAAARSPRPPHRHAGGDPRPGRRPPGPGRPADLLLFDLDRAWRIDPEAFESKSKNSPFEGLPVQGRVRRTVVDGRSLFEAA